MKLGRYDEAIGRFQEAAKHNKMSLWSWYHWGVALVHLGKLEEAIDKFQQVVKIKPDFLRHTMIGVLC